MKNSIANYFYYARSERQGIALLLGLVVVLLAIPQLLLLRDPQIAAYETTEFKAFGSWVTEFEAQNRRTFSDDDDFSAPALALGAFNPNTASFQTLLALGFSGKVAHTLINYREKGGVFKKPEDLKKIYGLSAADYSRFEPFIELGEGFARTESYKHFDKKYRNEDDFEPNANQLGGTATLFNFDPNTASEMELLSLGIDKFTVKNLLKFREKNGKILNSKDLKKIYGFSEIDFLRLSKYVTIVPQKPDNQSITTNEVVYAESRSNPQDRAVSAEMQIDLNSADYEKLLELRGIGRTFALRILDQREKLGGFASLEQLKNIYGLPDSTYQNVYPRLRLSPVFRKLQVNKARITELMHPYLSRKEAEIILRYRVNHGDFKSIEDLRKVEILSEEKLNMLKPYLEF
jgi:competence protein ComEA